MHMELENDVKLHLKTFAPKLIPNSFAVQIASSANEFHKNEFLLLGFFASLRVRRE